MSSSLRGSHRERELQNSKVFALTGHYMASKQPGKGLYALIRNIYNRNSITKVENLSVGLKKHIYGNFQIT